MLFLILLLFQLLGTCLSQADMTAEEEQALINYVIELYYFPNKPDIREYETPEQYPNFKKRYYFYDYINCLHESDILGVIDASILSHTICISLCDEYSDCKGGLYSKIRNKCYLLKNVKCMSEAERLERGIEKDVWNVFFFYNAQQCAKPQPNDEKCEEETTTIAPTEAATQAQKEDEREKLGQRQGQGVKQPGAVSISSSISVTLARSAADPYKSVAQASYEMGPRQKTVATTSKYYPLRDTSDQTVGEVVNQAAKAEKTKPLSYAKQRTMELQAEIDKLDAQLAKGKVGNPKGVRPSPYERNPPRKVPADRQPLLPEVPTHDLTPENTPQQTRRKSPTKEAFTTAQQCEPALGRRKRLLGSNVEKCKKFTKKLMNSIESLKKKVNYVSNLKGNVLQEMRQQVEKQFQRFKNSKFGGHLKKVNKVGQVAAFGLMAGSLVTDLLSGNFEGVAMNAGYFILAYATSKMSEKAAKFGAELLAKGKIKAGWLFKAAGPFLHTIGAAIVVYEFYKSIRDLNTSDSDSIANVVANGILLGVEVFELGMMVLATAGVISASAAATAGPIGIAVAAVVFVGLRIYYVVKEVEHIKKTLRLSDWEIFREGFKRFFTGYGLVYLDEMLREKTRNNQYRDIAIKSLQKNEDLQMYFLPALKINGDKEELAKERKIDLTKQVTVPYSRSAPDNTGNYKIVCFPPAKNANEGTTTDYDCQNAFGVMDTSRRGKTDTYFELPEGTDHVFARNVTNSYAIGNGLKEIKGNAATDIFILNGNTTKGSLDGSDGYDMIYAKFFHKSVAVNFDVINKNDLSINHFDYEAGIRQYISATNIEDIRGRPDASDAVTVPCNLKYLNAHGGQNKIRGRDMIFLQEECQDKSQYNVTISLGSNSVLKNTADRGRFVYHFANISGHNFIHLKKGSFQNIFVFEYKIEELIEIKRIQADSLIFFFLDHSDLSKTAKISVKNFDNQTVFAFKEEVVVRIGDSNAYLTLMSDLSRDGIIRKYIGVVYRHGFILKARSKPDSVAIAMGHDMYGFGNKQDSKNVLSNEGDEITHVYPGRAKNVYLITADEEMYNKSIEEFKIPNVYIHYDYTPYFEDQVDLSVLAQKIKWSFKLDLIVEAVSEYTNKNIILYIHVVNSKQERVKTIGGIVLENVLLNFVYKQISIGLKSGFSINLVENELIEAESSDVSIDLRPMPISFDRNEHELVVLTEDDVSYDHVINVDHNLGDFDYFAYNESLVITNMAIKGVETDQLFSVLLTNFTKSAVMQSINLNFKDVWLSMKANVNVHGILQTPDSSSMFQRFI